MSTTIIKFNAKLLVGGAPVPIMSQVVTGDDNSQDGVENGFIFQLDRQEDDPPVTIYLGDMIQFIESKLGIGNLASNPGMAIISQAFPSLNPSNFNPQNQTIVDIYEFTLNSSSKEVLFSFNINIENSDPTTNPLIKLPAVFSSWLKIQSISIAFKSKSQKSQS